MNIIGIDASLNNTGIVVIDNNGKLIEFHSIKFKNTFGIGRLSIFNVDFRDIMKKIRESYVGSIYSIEDYTFGMRNSRSLISLGEQGGLIRLYLHNNLLKYYKYSPSSIKKFITGKGNTKKNLILKSVYKKWNIDFDDDNLADAYSVARLCLAEYQVRNNFKPLSYFLGYEQEVLKKILKPVKTK